MAKQIYAKLWRELLLSKLRVEFFKKVTLKNKFRQNYVKNLLFSELEVEFPNCKELIKKLFSKIKKKVVIKWVGSGVVQQLHQKEIFAKLWRDF